MKKSDLVLTRLELAKNNTRDKFKTFNSCDEIYHGVNKQQPTHSQVNNPYSWSNVETIVPRMVAKRPTILYSPQEPQDKDVSEIMTALFEYWWDKDKAFNKTVSWIKDALVYGTGIAKVYWKTIKKNVTSYEYGGDGKPVIDENGEFVTKTETITQYDDPCLENVNVYDFFIDPEATEIQSASWVIHRYWKTIGELEQAGYYKNIAKLKTLLASVEKSPEEYRRHEVAFGSRGEQDDTVDKIEILEMWDQDGMTVLAAKDVVIREQANPFWHGKIPFISLRDSIVSQEFYGKGEIEPVIKLQHALNTIQNQIIDNRNQILMSMWKVKGDIDESELIARPNGIIHLDAGVESDANPIEFPDLTQNAANDLSLLKADIQQALGIYDYTKGAESSTNKTATGISMIQEAANARFAHKIQILEEALKELGGVVLALYQQFITDEKIIRVTGKQGEDFVRILPAEIAGEYDCVPEAGSTQPINKETERQDALQVYSLVAQLPYENTKNELLKEIIEKYGMNTVSEALDADLEIMSQQMAEQEQMKQKQQMMQGQAEQEQQMAMQQQSEQEQMMAQEQADADRQKQLEDMQIKHEMDLEKIQATQAMKQPMM